MILVADENIVGLEALPAGVEVRALPGRSIDAAVLRGADALWVRSVTPVTRALLAGTRLRFVGTATAGREHVDLAALAEKGIAFAAAPGANAMAVVEYVLAALLALKAPWRRLEAGATLGIVGCGAVGRRLARFADAMGWSVCVCDPWLDSDAAGRDLAALEQVLGCEVISLHCSLEHRDPWPSYHLIDAAVLGRLDERQTLINAARGAVVDNAALLEHLRGRKPAQVVLDVWEGEPSIDWRLLEAGTLRLATPHIGGYSWDAKWAATRMLWQAMRAAGVCHGALGQAEAPLPALPALSTASGADDVEATSALIRACFDIRRDDAALRAVALQPPARRAADFDGLRKAYPLRREVLAAAGPDRTRPCRFLDALALASQV